MLTKADIEKYFIVEKQASLLFLIIGLVAIVLAIIGFIVYKTQAWKGAAIPLLAIGLIQITVGFAVYKRSDDDRMRVIYAYDLNPNDIKISELPRMNAVNKNLTIYRWVEIILTIIGLALIFFSRYFTLQSSVANLEFSFSFGFGIALAMQAILMLSADYYAEKRATIYTKKLQTFVEKKQKVNS